METVFSGIQPSGGFHIGNYFGAVQNWVELQDKYRCLYCVVDLHALTQSYDTKQMQPRVEALAAELLASGIDPNRSVLFVQSHVPEHSELAWILSTVTPYGELSRMTQFKEKSQKEPDNINAGLMSYPILMAADVLLYRATRIPVGDDQVQHLELAREICRRFNARFGDIFPEPQPLHTKALRIMGLDGKQKMSKSLGNVFNCDQIAAAVGGEALRMFCVEHHYRSPVDFDVQVVDGVARFFSLESSDRSLSGFYTTLQRIDQFIAPGGDAGDGAVLPEAESLVPAAKAALAEDFNAPEVVAAMHGAARLANKLLDEGKGVDKQVRRRTLARLGRDLRTVGGAIGVLTQDPGAYLRERRERLVKAKKIDVAAVEQKLAERKAARAEKNFQRADEIRRELTAMGVELLDTPTGTDWRIADAD